MSNLYFPIPHQDLTLNVRITPSIILVVSVATGLISSKRQCHILLCGHTLRWSCIVVNHTLGKLECSGSPIVFPPLKHRLLGVAIVVRPSEIRDGPLLTGTLIRESGGPCDLFSFHRFDALIDKVLEGWQSPKYRELSP